MNKSIPRDREPFSRSKDDDYKFLGSPLARKAADFTITKRRMGSSPGRHGVKAPYPPTARVSRPADRNKYMPHQGKRETARRVAQAARLA